MPTRTRRDGADPPALLGAAPRGGSGLALGALGRSVEKRGQRAAAVRAQQRA